MPSEHFLPVTLDGQTINVPVRHYIRQLRLDGDTTTASIMEAVLEAYLTCADTLAQQNEKGWSWALAEDDHRDCV